MRNVIESSREKEPRKIPRPHPSPARARPPSPYAEATGEIGRTARCPPPHPRGARLPCETKAHEQQNTAELLSQGAGAPAPPSRPAFVARLALAARLSVL